ncbi:uncharacterized protein [Littorina saxatilis]|uniref:Uncharacterized protein n=1 Tax=Littorina saxatilis TaxID=31220 RepID=A0AAN9FZM7_9CAEN
MTLRTSFMASSLFNKLSLIFSLIAMLTAWISFVMPAWGFTGDPDNSARGYGLWRLCGQGATSPGCSDLTGWNLAWYGTVQAFATLGFLGVNLAFLLIVLQIFVDKCKGANEVAFWNFVQCIVTAVCYLIAIIVFAAEFDSTYRANPLIKQELGYSWGLAIVALVVNGIAVTILQFMEGRSAL